MNKRTSTIKFSSVKLLKLMRDNLNEFEIGEKVVNYCIDGIVTVTKDDATTMVLTITDKV